MIPSFYGRRFSNSPKFSASLGLSRAKAFGTQPPITSGAASRQPPIASDRLRRILQSTGAIGGYPALSGAVRTEINFPPTSFPVSAIRIDLNSAAVLDWNEIDAVSISGVTP